MSSTFLRSLSAQKAVTYGLGASRRLGSLDSARVAHRHFTTILNTAHPARQLRSRYASSAASLRHAVGASRGISYGAIPRFMLRAFRVPIAGATIGAGGLTYANYRFEGMCFFRGYATALYLQFEYLAHYLSVIHGRGA